MGNVVSSVIFCARNIDKAENQDKVGRWPVAIAQADNIFQAVKKLDNGLGKTARTASEVLQKGAKQEKLIEGMGKGLNFLSKNINPLICVSAGIDVLNSDNKVEAFTTNTTALASMFMVEDYMKKHLDEYVNKGVSKLVEVKDKNKTLEKIVDAIAKTKYAGKIPKIISGVAFVIGSCTAYDIGDKFGNLLIGENPAEEKARA